MRKILNYGLHYIFMHSVGQYNTETHSNSFRRQDYREWWRKYLKSWWKIIFLQLEKDWG